MGFPTLLYQRLRRTKGTRTFVVRDIFALCTVAVSSVIGVGIGFTQLADEFRKALANGAFDNSPEFEQKAMYLNSMMIPTPSQNLAKLEEREKNFMDGVLRTSELLGER